MQWLGLVVLLALGILVGVMLPEDWQSWIKLQTREQICTQSKQLEIQYCKSTAQVPAPEKQ